ncbi:MAG: putative Ig domain-containing protein, partial [Mycoplasmataceae bacterium]|nr:putative Ig domain-containing protein [Mycoplasmataceae bacterium]
KIAIVSTIFILMPFITCALLFISANKNGNGNNFSSSTSTLTIDNIEPIEWGVMTEGSTEVVSNSIVTKLDDEIIDSSTISENSLLKYRLSGSLPIGLNFNQDTGKIYGTPTQITPAEEPLHIMVLYYPDKNSTNCIVGESNDFTIAIYGLIITNTIKDVVSYMEDGFLTTNAPQITFKGAQITNSDITWSLTEDSDTFLDGLDLNTAGQICGIPAASTSTPLNYRIKAQYHGYTALSNSFKISVIYDPKNVFTIKGVTNLEKHYLDGNKNDINEDNTWMEPIIVGDGTALIGTYTTTYKLNKSLPEGIEIEYDTGKIYGQFETEEFDENYVLTVTFTGELTSFEFLIFFSIKVGPIELELSVIGSQVTQINGVPFDIHFVLKLNKEEVEPSSIYPTTSPPEGMTFDEEEKRLYGMPDAVNKLSTEDIYFSPIEFCATLIYNQKSINSNHCVINLKLESSFKLDYEDGINNVNMTNFHGSYIPLVKSLDGKEIKLFVKNSSFEEVEDVMEFFPIPILNKRDITGGYVFNSNEYETSYSFEFFDSNGEEMTYSEEDGIGGCLHVEEDTGKISLRIGSGDWYDFLDENITIKITATHKNISDGTTKAETDILLKIVLMDKFVYELQLIVPDGGDNPLPPLSESYANDVQNGNAQKDERIHYVGMNWGAYEYTIFGNTFSRFITFQLTFKMNGEVRTSSDLKYNQRVKIRLDNNEPGFSFNPSTLQISLVLNEYNKGSRTMIISYEEWDIENDLWNIKNLAYFDLTFTREPDS